MPNKNKRVVIITLFYEEFDEFSFINFCKHFPGNTSQVP